MTKTEKIKQRTVNELGGEIWAEINMEQRVDPDSRIAEIHFETVIEITDLITAVLARHVDEVIVNDEDFPVTPFPYKFEPEL